MWSKERDGGGAGRAECSGGTSPGAPVGKIVGQLLLLQNQGAEQTETDGTESIPPATTSDPRKQMCFDSQAHVCSMERRELHRGRTEKKSEWHRNRSNEEKKQIA